MNKTITRYKKTFKIFGIKFGETDEKYETVFMENVEPIDSLIVTEYEIENINNNNNIKDD